MTVPARRSTDRAIALLRGDLAHAWSVTELADAVALSRSQLTRLFRRELGATPLRLLTELRLTEFTRLVEETDLTIAAAAKQVGWRDPRVASDWFLRRHLMTPTEFRNQPLAVQERTFTCTACPRRCAARPTGRSSFDASWSAGDAR